MAIRFCRVSSDSHSVESGSLSLPTRQPEVHSTGPAALRQTKLPSTERASSSAKPRAAHPSVISAPLRFAALPALVRVSRNPQGRALHISAFRFVATISSESNELQLSGSVLDNPLRMRIIATFPISNKCFGGLRINFKIISYMVSDRFLDELDRVFF